jgi:outer membrane lipopolysaccharide assembly protein LptE/RlpB
MKKILILFIVMGLSGCGYSVRSIADIPIKEVRIDSILNKTSVPDIEDILYRTLASELKRQGIAVVNTSTYTLSGVIRDFKLKVVSEKGEFAREYEVLIGADFVVTGPGDYVKKFNAITSPFIESFIAERGINSIVSFKEIATEQALESLARRLVSEVMYR